MTIIRLLRLGFEVLLIFLLVLLQVQSVKFVDHRFLLDFEGCLHWDRDLETPDHRFFFFIKIFVVGGVGWCYSALGLGFQFLLCMNNNSIYCEHK